MNASRDEMSPSARFAELGIGGNDEDRMDLHAAVALDRVTAVKDILSSDAGLSLLHEQNDDGDQPAHVAARLNRLDCMRILIGHDAHMGRRNWAGLTPIGEARMNGHKSMVELLSANYVLGKNATERDWDEEATREASEWREAWDEGAQVQYWERVDTDGNVSESSWHPPPVDSSLLLRSRDERCERNVVRRIHPRAIESMAVRAEIERKERMEERAREAVRDWQMRRERDCAIRLQTKFRGKKAERLRLRLEVEHRSARRIQVAWRWRYRDYRHRMRQRAARRLQSYHRMRSARHYYQNFLRERLWWHRSTLLLANVGQRLWRGFKGRSATRRLRERNTLPDPDDVRNYDRWVEIQDQSNPPRRKLGIMAEYVLSGHPRSWTERNGTKRHERYYRDVRFYANAVTRRALWDQPTEWSTRDAEDFERREEVRRLGYTTAANDAARAMQALWRAKVARRNFRLIMRSKSIMDDAERTYLFNPTDGRAVCNYALYVHVHLQDYDKARPLYQSMLAYMNRRGVDNPFVLYGLAIFGAATHEEDWDIIKDYAHRARVAESRTNNARAETGSRRTSSYEMADVGFYRIAALRHQNAAGWHNYGLCRMVAFHDLTGARDAFLRALEISSPRDNDKIVSNFNVLLQDRDYMAKPPPWDASDEVLLDKRQNSKKLKRVG